MTTVIATTASVAVLTARDETVRVGVVGGGADGHNEGAHQRAFGRDRELGSHLDWSVERDRARDRG